MLSGGAVLSGTTRTPCNEILEEAGGGRPPGSIPRASHPERRREWLLRCQLVNQAKSLAEVGTQLLSNGGVPQLPKDLLLQLADLWPAYFEESTEYLLRVARS